MIKYFSNLYTKKQLESLGYGKDLPSAGKKTTGPFLNHDDGKQNTFEITNIAKKSTYNQNLYQLEFFRDSEYNH